MMNRLLPDDCFHVFFKDSCSPPAGRWQNNSLISEPLTLIAHIDVPLSLQPLYPLAYVLYFSSLVLPWAKVPSNGPLEDFYQERKQGARQSCVPAALGRFISDECMLSLNLDELMYMNSKLLLPCPS